MKSSKKFFKLNKLNYFILILSFITAYAVSPTLGEQQALPSQMVEDTTSTASKIDQLEDYVRDMFRDLLPKLESILKLKEEHENLPRRTYFFGKDQRQNQNEIEAILDEAIEILDVSESNRERVEIRELRKQITEAELNIARYRELKVSAPSNDELGTLGKLNPLKKTKEHYDEQISEEEDKIAELKSQIERIKSNFIDRLRSFGISISEEEVDNLLASVVGDDFIELCNVFANLKKVTLQLQHLTEKSGESLEVAKRYYGMYVVLNELLDRLQKEFIKTIENNHIPDLKGYVKEAEQNIEEAKDLMKSNHADKSILQSNIESNKLTMEAAKLYINYLESQVETINRENKSVERHLATARNTYKTVRLSSNVSELIQSGRKNFDALMKLELPKLRGFENQVMQQEFRRLTEEISEPR